MLGSDYLGLKPRLAVQEGDVIAAGAPVFAHKDTADVQVVSPVSGRVKAVNRGARRVLVSVEIEVDAAAAEPVAEESPEPSKPAKPKRGWWQRTFGDE